MFTNLQLVEFVKQVYIEKWVYWYGTCGYKCSQSLYNSKAKQYPAHYTASRKSGYMKDISEDKMCADCVGMIKAFFWMGGSTKGKNVYASNKCPDASADEMIDICKEKGPISTMPDVPGLVVWKKGHIGVYIGNGYTIEMKGFNYDCVKNKVSSGPWTKWGKLPSTMIQYVDSTEQKNEESKPAAMFNVKVVSGSWNVRTAPDKNAKSVGVVRTGDKLPYLNETTNGWDAVEYNGSKAYISTKGTEIVKNESPKRIEIKGTWYVRTAPDKEADSIGVVRTGDYVPYQGEDKDGWYLVEFKNQNAWISTKAGKIVE